MNNVTPIRPRQPMTPARAIALALAAASEFLRRTQVLAKKYPVGDIAVAVILADSSEDEALVGRMAGKAAHAVWRLLGIAEDGSDVPLPPSDESVEEACAGALSRGADDAGGEFAAALRRVADLLGVPR